MKDNKSVIKSMRITPNDDNLLNILDINFNEFVENALHKEFKRMVCGEIDKEIKKLKERIILLEKLKIDSLPNLKNKKELEHLRETKNIINSKPEYLEARIKMYSKEFNKVLLTEEEFKKLLNKVK